MPIEFQKKMMKECGIHLIDIPYTDCSCWCWICDESDLPKEEDVRYMAKVFRSKVFIKVVKQDEGMQVMTYEQIKQMRITNDEHLYGWRYVTPMDSADYNGLYGNHIRVSTRELSDDIVDLNIECGTEKRLADEAICTCLFCLVLAATAN